MRSKYTQSKVQLLSSLIIFIKHINPKTTQIDRFFDQIAFQTTKIATILTVRNSTLRRKTPESDDGNHAKMAA